MKSLKLADKYNQSHAHTERFSQALQIIGKNLIEKVIRALSLLEMLVKSAVLIIEHAIIDSARAAYLATLLEKGHTKPEKYAKDSNSIKDLVIQPSLPNKLNKLKTNLPEAYYYWAKTIELL